MTKDHLPNYLRTYRKRACLSQRQVAHLLGANSGTKVSRYEHYTRIPDLVTVFALEIVYGAPASELFAGIFDQARQLVESRATHAVTGRDAALASFARQILDPSITREEKPRTTFA